MMFTAPMPYTEALNAQAVKSILPTSGRTVDLQKLEPAIKRRAMFSATVQSVTHLQKIDDLVKGILAGQIDQASARLAVKQLLAEQGYAPDPEHVGGLRDLSSTQRINLQLETNVDIARGFGWHEQGQEPMVLDAFPAEELVRFFGPSNASAQRDWAARWEKAGGKFYGGRMIALKSDPVWAALGSVDNFDDALGNPYPPFAFNSGMDVQDIDRAEAVELGLIDENTELFPQSGSLNESLQATPDVRSQELRGLLEESGLGSFTDGGVFKFKEGAAA